MTNARQRPERRTDALTRVRIVETAIALLDAGGTDALTFRALAAELSTGAGALYHHVSNKSELLSAAATGMITDVLATAGSADPAASIRQVTAGVFAAIVAHPWLGSQLVAAPWQPAVLQLFDRIGSEVTALGVPAPEQFDAASALVHHVLGVASQYDAGQHLGDVRADRPGFIESSTSPLVGSDSGRYPFLARIERQLVEHDDREQFRAGIEIILTGVAALRSDRTTDEQRAVRGGRS
ncbi:TetR/AcrR family transcriptional regulator [Curtobacterium sp. L1-20]|uniref:TetR/AcrR family transcriptional regulator n=1 Tax=Curtobacterium sp. L1-20 TaxID=3138181 RepID=UPI003B520943